jgi:hypothetical protein
MCGVQPVYRGVRSRRNEFGMGCERRVAGRTDRGDQTQFGAIVRRRFVDALDNTSIKCVFDAFHVQHMVQEHGGMYA